MDMDLNCPQEFEVRQPRWLLVVGIVLIVVFVAVAAFIIQQTYAGEYTVEQAALMIIPFGIITLFLGILGLYSYCNDTFKYSNGEFMCKRVLRRTREWKIDDVSCVKLVWFRSAYRRAVNILFFGKNDKKIATVTDGIWVWEDGRLRTLLYVNNIPVEGDKTV
ncbi:MAG: hypothetical protein K2M64_03615 [Clostridia bacterium]|nr:hypothetical protein [Clostridia bacterium]